MPGTGHCQYNLNRPSLLIRAEDGLPNHYFRGLAMDANDFRWIGSYDGLARFNKFSLQFSYPKSTLSHPCITCFLKTK